MFKQASLVILLSSAAVSNALFEDFSLDESDVIMSSQVSKKARVLVSKTFLECLTFASKDRMFQSGRLFWVKIS
jgi:hypothetical protein